MSCPIIDGAIEKEFGYNLNKREIKRFCELGCSVICDELLRELISSKVAKSNNIKGQVKWDL